MLSRVVVQNENPFYLEIADARPDDSIIVDRIEGLDPPDIELFLGEYARDGGFYSGRRVGKRNPVIYLTLNPKYEEGETVAGLRELLYRAFIDPQVLGDEITVLLQDDDKPERYFTGYTEKIESSIFAKDTDVAISMVCPNPYLLSSDESVLNVNGSSVPFTYLGTAETGVEIKIQFVTSSSALTVNLDGAATLTLNYAFLANDLVYINTKRGERKIQLIRGGSISDLGVIAGGTTTTILYAKTSSSRWIELHQLPNAQNVLSVYGVAPTNIVANIRQIRHRANWWAI